MQSRYIEFNGRMYQLRIHRSVNDYVTEILESGNNACNIIASLTFENPPTDDMIKQALQSEVQNIKVLELAD